MPPIEQIPQHQKTLLLSFLIDQVFLRLVRVQLANVWLLVMISLAIYALSYFTPDGHQLEKIMNIFMFGEFYAKGDGHIDLGPYFGRWISLTTLLLAVLSWLWDLIKKPEQKPFLLVETLKGRIRTHALILSGVFVLSAILCLQTFGAEKFWIFLLMYGLFFVPMIFGWVITATLLEKLLLFVKEQAESSRARQGSI